ncbi:sulfatase [Kitasatospora sp. NPDC090308]|uniref:sulfatase n=1 Tax=Kitasatospora sp. NPDC090308 TaxID=3364082 RepID=UPI00380962D1
MTGTRRKALGALALPAALTLSVLAAPATAQPARPAASTASAAPAKPNIVLILADDLGWADVSTPLTTAGHPNDYIETPAVARLAQQGVAFDNAYASQNCAPSRAELLTGLYPTRPDNNIYQVDDLNRGGSETLLVGPAQGLPDGAPDLPGRVTTVGETLRGAGYTTGYVGKFHVAEHDSDITSVHGFDENIGGSSAGQPGAYHAKGGVFASEIGPGLDAFGAPYTQQYVDANIKPYARGEDPAAVNALVGTDKHVTDAVTDATIDFVDRHKDAPFFAFMGSYAVHNPVSAGQARADLLAKYRQKKPGTGISNAAYAALTEGLDQGVARVVDHLETTPDPRNPGHALADNTVVVFASDNGGLGTYTDNGPLRGQKGELHEGGLRVPLIAWSANPALVRGGRVDSTPVDTIDYYPTFAALAGAALPAGQPLDGKDLSRLFADPAATVDRDALYWHLPGYLAENGRDQRPQSVIRSGRWKLVFDYETHSAALYDLVNDLGETHDLAGEQKAVAHSLGLKLINWLEQTHAPLATLRAGHEPISFPVLGKTYSGGQITRHVGENVTVQPGQEMPFVLPRVQ